MNLDANITMDKNSTVVANNVIGNVGNVSDKIVDAFCTAGHSLLFCFGQGEKFVRHQRMKALTDAQTKKDVELIEKGEAAFNGKEINFITSGSPDLKQQNVLGLLHQQALTREYRKQERLANILDYVVEEAKENNALNDEPLDPDWFAEWINTAENIHKESLQKIWAKILVKEAVQPRTFSLRVFDFLKYLTPNAATLIEKMACYVLNKSLCHRVKKTTLDFTFGDFPSEFLSFKARMDLTELGLLYPGNMLSQEIKSIQMLKIHLKQR